MGIFTFDWERFKKCKPDHTNKIYEHVVAVTHQKEQYNRQRDYTDPSRNQMKYLIGKVAEYAAFAYIYWSATTMITKPDLNVYQYGDGGSDMVCTASTGIYNIHVKSCTIESQKVFGHEWLFRRSEQLVTKPKKNDIIVLTRERKNGNGEIKIEIMKIIKAIDLKGYSPALTSKGDWIETKCKLMLYKLEDDGIPDFQIV